MLTKEDHAAIGFAILLEKGEISEEDINKELARQWAVREERMEELMED